MMTTIEYSLGLKPEYVETAVQLYDEAFGSKFALAIPSQEARLALFMQSFRGEFAICATSENRLVGLAGFHTAEGSLTSGINASDLFKQLGVLGGLRAIAIFSLYERTLKPGELLMDGIAVDQTFRGKGVGSQLLREIVNYAQQQGFASVRLDVIDTNPGARRLYERRGFEPVHSESFPYLQRFLGFGGATTMTLAVENGLK